MRSLLGLVVGIGALVGYVHLPAAPGSVMEPSVPAVVPQVTCGAQFAYDVVRDKRRREQAFELTLEPGAAARIDVPSLWETFTVTARHEGGGPARTFDNRQGEPRAVIGNTSSSPQTYRVTVRRTTDARFSFTVSCAPVSTDGEASGDTDERTCIAGAACARSTSGGQLSGTCSADAVDLTDPRTRSAQLAFCR